MPVRIGDTLADSLVDIRIAARDCHLALDAGRDGARFSVGQQLGYVTGREAVDLVRLHAGPAVFPRRHHSAVATRLAPAGLAS